MQTYINLIIKELDKWDLNCVQNASAKKELAESLTRIFFRNPIFKILKGNTPKAKYESLQGLIQALKDAESQFRDGKYTIIANGIKNTLKNLLNEK